ncbi:hypothetical protein SDJN02_27461, partial [Cucurbita argyrosperma subsp. argyrosperma]
MSFGGTGLPGLAAADQTDQIPHPDSQALTGSVTLCPQLSMQSLQVDVGEGSEGEDFHPQVAHHKQMEA